MILSSNQKLGEFEAYIEQQLREVDGYYATVLQSNEPTVLPEGNFFHVSNFTISLYGKYLCYAILAISVDLLWGYTGLLCLGQALFFSLGGYMMGMYLMRMIGDLGQYHKPIPGASRTHLRVPQLE